MDALDPTLGPLLEQLGVNLVVIPAMTTKTASMVNLASHLVAARQAFVVLANGPASMPGQRRGSPGRQEACFLGPVSYTHLDVYKRQEYAAPAPSHPGLESVVTSAATGRRRRGAAAYRIDQLHSTRWSRRHSCTRSTEPLWGSGPRFHRPR